MKLKPMISNSAKIITTIVFLSLYLPNLLSGQEAIVSDAANRVITFSNENKYWLLFQDKMGFIWGYDKNRNIVRFDGYEYKTFHHDPEDVATISCASNPNFLEDSTGKLWIGLTDCGVDVYDPASGNFMRHSDNLRQVRKRAPGTINTLLQDKTGDIWVGTQTGIFHYSHQEKKFDFVSDVEHCGILFEDKKGNFWALNSNSSTLSRLVPGRLSIGEQLQFPVIKKSLLQEHQQNINSAVPLKGKAGEDLYLIVSWFHMYLFDANSRKVKLIDKGLNRHETVRSVFFEGDLILAGTDKGRVLKYETETSSLEPYLDFSTNNPETGGVLKIFKSKGANGGIPILWVVTQRQTFQVLPASSFEFIKFPANIIQSTRLPCQKAVSFQGKAYFITTSGLEPVLKREGKPIRLDYPFPGKEVQQKFPHVENLTDFIVLKFMEDPAKKTLWMAQMIHPYGLRLMQFDANGKILYNKYCTGRNDSCFDDQIRDLSWDAEGRLWMAGFSGVSRFNPQGGNFVNFTAHADYFDNSTYSICVDKAQKIWLGTASEGLFYYDPKSGKFVPHNINGENVNDISSKLRLSNIMEDNSGNLWISTLSGLNRFNTETGVVNKYYQKDGLPSSTILFAINDKNNHVWLQSEKQITINIKEGRFYNFDQKDGLPDGSFSPNAKPISDEKGNLFFTHSRGLVRCNPDNVVLENAIPKLMFTDFQLANQPVAVGDESGTLHQSIEFTKSIVLNHRQNVFIIRYAAQEYLFPDEIQYAFKLVGFDKNWRSVGNVRRATYTHLNQGTYHFWVKCSNRYGEWGKPISMAVIVLPPWWRTWWAYLIYFIVTGVLLYYIRNFELNKRLASAETKRLQELDAVKTRLYTNVTHEFRTPLTIILGLSEQLENQVGESAKKGLQKIQRSGRELLNLINQMLSLSKLESGALPVNLVQSDLVRFMRYLVESFTSFAAGYKVKLTFHSEMEEFIMDYDPEKIQMIVNNLISNAIKFNREDGEVQLFLKSAGQCAIELQIKDTGFGIPADKVPLVFERFYQVDDTIRRRNEGTGIGLALVKELVTLIKGTINLESVEGKGTTFYLTLPVTRTAPITEPSKTEKVKSFKESAKVPEHESWMPSDLPRLLIIEDNKELISFIVQILHGQYLISTALDGKEGMQKVYETMPDIILCDVMMPGMDGFQICRTLKKDMVTCHIPLVLLTAKVDLKSKLQGLDYGADAYIGKPFQPNELKLRLKKLLDKKRTLRDYYGSKAYLQSESPETIPGVRSKKDSDFLNSFILYVEENIQDTDMNMELLCKKLGTSRSSLFRKLKALTNMSAMDLIREIRLRKGSEYILKEPSMNLSEIASAVGFISLSHFSKSFKVKFGCSPQQYRNNPTTVS